MDFKTYILYGASVILIGMLLSPIIRKSIGLQIHILVTRLICLFLPNQLILVISDPEIMDLGEAMYMEGMDTRYINQLMLGLVAEKMARNDGYISRYHSVRALPGGKGY